MATTTSEETGRHVALVDIRVPDNVRDLDPEHVKALAGSIGLQGMLVPVVVRNDGEGFELVAGFHRLTAAKSLGLTAVPVVIRDAQTEDADRAVENITRKQLNPYEEAKAVRAMLERGLTEDGAAQALGWPKQRVTARVKLLELPERAQQLIGEGVIHLAAVDQLRAIGTVAPNLLDAVIAYLDDGDGVEDGFEYQSAIDLNNDDYQSPNTSLPYPGKTPYPNPLFKDADVDYDGDVLTLGEEYSLWKYTYTVNHTSTRTLTPLSYS